MQNCKTSQNRASNVPKTTHHVNKTPKNTHPTCTTNLKKGRLELNLRTSPVWFGSSAAMVPFLAPPTVQKIRRRKAHAQQGLRRWWRVSERAYLYCLSNTFCLLNFLNVGQHVHAPIQNFLTYNLDILEKLTNIHIFQNCLICHRFESINIFGAKFQNFQNKNRTVICYFG